MIPTAKGFSLSTKDIVWRGNNGSVHHKMVAPMLICMAMIVAGVNELVRYFWTAKPIGPVLKQKMAAIVAVEVCGLLCWIDMTNLPEFVKCN